MKKRLAEIFILIAASCIGLLNSDCVSADVRAWEGDITIPTYIWEEDINPKFWAFEGGAKMSTTVRGAIVYPYVMQDHLLRDKVNRKYKALFLENEYLKGHLLTSAGRTFALGVGQDGRRRDVLSQFRDQAGHDRHARGVDQRRRRMEFRTARAYGDRRSRQSMRWSVQTRMVRPIWRSAIWSRSSALDGRSV